ncbi:DUF262 domain-containing protein [Campylobacter sp. MOP7]|uniref:DUF262 domain-containing protein n=1 Tax=Campylobacter canis TaxID=3378588 RepID=UPI00387E4DF1
MIDELEKGLQSLDMMFDGIRLFRIPDYQRGYAWTKQQLHDFWKDLESLEEGESHYTGVIMLESLSNEDRLLNADAWKKDYGTLEASNLYCIVDGQQRLTTSIIFIHTILAKLKERGVYTCLGYKNEELIGKYISKDAGYISQTYLFGYMSDDPSYEYLKTAIFGDKSSKNKNEKTLYTENLKTARNFFVKKIEQMAPNEIEQLFKKLTTQFKFNVYIVPKDLNVYASFEAMNNRGLKLSNFELLKNRLIYLSSKIEPEKKGAELRQTINDCWKHIYAILGKNPKNPLNDDEYLKNHWILYYKFTKRTGNDYIKFLLDKFHIKNLKDGTLSTEEIYEYVMSLKECVSHWYYMLNPFEIKDCSYDNKDIIMWLDRLVRLDFPTFDPLLIIILSSFKKEDTPYMVELLNQMERFLFLVLCVSQRPVNTGDSEFYGYAKKYKDGEISIKELIKNTKEACKKHLNLENFRVKMGDYFSRQKHFGFFSWSYLKYFLYEYELHLKAMSKTGDLKIEWDEYVKSKKGNMRTIEHVLPQTPTNEYWQAVIKDLSLENVKAVTHSIGNLVPLSQAKNSKLSNLPYPKKREGKDGEFVGYQNGSYSEIKIAKDYEHWNIEAIKKRSSELADWFLIRWSLSDYVKDSKELKDKSDIIKQAFLSRLDGGSLI